jgi:hypothetical protein
MTSARQLSRAEILALPPVITLATLAQALGVSEPVIRAARRSGELETLGLRITRIGAQWRVVTSSLWAHLGLTAAVPEPGVTCLADVDPGSPTAWTEAARAGPMASGSWPGRGSGS